MRKHIFSVLLALALCLSLWPVPALASGEPEGPHAPAETPQNGAAEEAAAPETAEDGEDAAAVTGPMDADPAADADETNDMLWTDPALDGASNEETIYAFLTGTMGYNTAAACGILASIVRESSFNPTAVGGGGMSYGICQWTDWGSGVGRYTNLKKFCAANGYDYRTLEGQLYFLQYELNTGYTAIRDQMRTYPNTAQGAYDAGYYWCYRFESPSDTEATSRSRGALARDTYWPKYAAVCAVTFDADGGIAVSGVTVGSGSRLGTLPASTRRGYTFGGWYTGKNGTGTRLTSETVITADAVYYARWDANRYQVSFDAQGGALDTGTMTVAYDAAYGTLPVPTRFGFRFDGWYTEASGGERITGGSVVSTAANHTLFAHWTAVLSYTVTYDANGGAGAPMAQKKTHGTDLTITATRPRRTGYIFLGWAESPAADAAAYAPGGLFTEDRSVTLYAVWERSGPAGAETAADAAAYLGRGEAYDAVRVLRTAVGK